MSAQVILFPSARVQDRQDALLDAVARLAVEYAQIQLFPSVDGFASFAPRATDLLERVNQSRFADDPLIQNRRSLLASWIAFSNAYTRAFRKVPAPVAAEIQPKPKTKRRASRKAVSS